MMKSRIFLFLIITLAFSFKISAQKITKLSKVMELQMPDGDGTNGACVTWNKHKQLYYASFAGNTAYPLAVFSPTGSRVSKDDLTSGFDVRGLWYNTASKRLFCNGFAESGWSAYDLDGSGMPQTPTTVFEGMNQPEDQCVGVYDEKNNKVYFLSNTDVVAYDGGKGVKQNTISLKIGQIEKAEKSKDGKKTDKEDDDEMDEDDIYLSEIYNGTSVIFTGLKDKEFGLLNTETRAVELYSNASGNLTAKWEFPEGEPLNNSFNFAYANSIVWIFDTENRKWIGYK